MRVLRSSLSSVKNSLYSLEVKNLEQIIYFISVELPLSLRFNDDSYIHWKFFFSLEYTFRVALDFLLGTEEEDFNNRV